MSEAQRLETLSGAYDPANDFDKWMLRSFTAAISPLVAGRLVLELGCATGYTASLLLDAVGAIDLVDGSQHYIDIAKSRIHDSRVRFFVSLFENFEPDRRYDVIIFSHVLEHV
ncbi:MAG: class I SAM-dependent methyltransferase, partial [Candidatus Eremiobacteraeota bacterium]|nr:class I SAM-dependent methyltransferase [Candidatus Eremiobacteraeota bacterium]